MDNEFIINELHRYIKSDTSIQAKIENEIITICTNDPSYIKCLCIPGSNDPSWDIAAKIITKLDYKLVKPYMNEVCRYLEDANWYGSDYIENYLNEMPQDELIKVLTDALKLAYGEKDDEWIYFLSVVVSHNYLEDVFFVDPEMKKILDYGQYYTDNPKDYCDTICFPDKMNNAMIYIKISELITQYDKDNCSRDEVNRLIYWELKARMAETDEDKLQAQAQATLIRNAHQHIPCDHSTAYNRAGNAAK